MKYYTEVRLPRKAKYCAWPMTEDVLHEDHVPIEPVCVEGEIMSAREFLDTRYGNIEIGYDFVGDMMAQIMDEYATYVTIFTIAYKKIDEIRG